MRELLALKFFAEGEAQEAAGSYQETEYVPLRSLDRPPMSGRPAMLLCLLALAGAAGGYLASGRIWSWLFTL